MGTTPGAGKVEIADGDLQRGQWVKFHCEARCSWTDFKNLWSSVRQSRRSSSSHVGMLKVTPNTKPSSLAVAIEAEMNSKGCAAVALNPQNEVILVGAARSLA